jgi:hypothetical protein
VLKRKTALSRCKTQLPEWAAPTYFLKRLGADLTNPFLESLTIIEFV